MTDLTSNDLKLENVNVNGKKANFFIIRGADKTAAGEDLDVDVDCDVGFP